MVTRGKFITLEGGEGTGKTTQIKRLSKWLDEQGVEHICTREPGGTEEALKIRELLLTGDPDKFDALTEALLFSAARRDHLRKVIRPALAEGKWILCDRFADTSTVYQNIRGVELSDLMAMHNLVIGDDWPDLTLVMNGDLERGLSRKDGQAAKGLTEVRFESMEKDFHIQAQRIFLDLAKREPNRCVIVDATGSIPQVTQNLIDAIQQKFNLQAKAA